MSAHEAADQPPPLEGRNLVGDHVALVEALTREGVGRALERCREVARHTPPDAGPRA